MKTFIYRNPKAQRPTPRVVKLITKRSNSDCLVIHTHISKHNGKTYTTRFWTHKDTLSKPSFVARSKRRQLGVKQAQPKTKTLPKIGQK